MSAVRFKNTAKDIYFAINNTGPGNLNLSGNPKVAVNGPDDADENPYDVELTGTGVGLEMDIVQMGMLIPSGCSDNFKIKFEPSGAGPFSG